MKDFIMVMSMFLIVSSAIWYTFFTLLTDERRPRKGEKGAK
jgi:hypothetical protein